jgi:cation diffusion facilitator family transporter
MIHKEKMQDKKRTQDINTASIIGIIGNAVLAAAKISLGFISGSLAVVSDGIDSTTDIVTSFVTLLASRIIAKPPDVRHPYGHRRAEAVATKVVAFVIFFAGAQLIRATIENILSGAVRQFPSVLAIYVTVASIIGKVFLAYVQYSYGKKTGSSMLRANARNMLNDVLISFAVLLGLIVIFILQMPVFDYIVAMLVSAWILKTAVQIFLESSLEVMDGIDDESVYSTIFQAINEVKGARNPHRTRVRRIGDKFIIDVDIEVDARLTVKQGHAIALKAEEKIKQKLKNIYDIIVHIEPAGNIEEDEKFGLSERILKPEKKKSAAKNRGHSGE